MNREWSRPANLIFGLLLAAIAIAGCKKDSPQELPKKTVLPTIVENDGWWSNDYAAQVAENRCARDGTTPCDDNTEPVREARQAETDFEGKLSASFQADPTCSGLTLRGFGGRNNRITDADSLVKSAASTANAGAQEYWFLIVDFVPEEEKQSWSMDILPSHTNNVSGEGDSKSMAHTICSVAKGVGGKVVD
jgi:hypothetical protein